MNWVIKAKHLNNEKRLIGLEVEDGDGSCNASIKWDGYMEINLLSKTEEKFTLVDTIHTSDIDGLIDKLKSLKQTCIDYFDDWNENGNARGLNYMENVGYGEDNEEPTYY